MNIRPVFTILLFLSVLWTDVSAQGIEFFEGTWEEALELAKQEEKLIFVDCYAEWCGPCKRMAAQVFPDPGVGAFFNENFINLKWDMEKGKGLEFRKKYPVSAFPTLYFLDPDGKSVVSVRGARDIAGLIALGEQALAKFNPHADFSDMYNEGDRSPETVYFHFSNLKKQGENIRPMANEYFRTDVDYTDENNLRLLTVVVDEVDSRLFDLLVEHKEAIIQLEGREKFETTVLDAGWNTVSKAMDFREPFLLDEATKKLKFARHPEVESFEQRGKIYYSLRVRDEPMYRNNMDRFLRQSGASLPDAAIELLDLGMRFFGNSSDFIGFVSEPWGAMAENSNLPEVHYKYAELLKQTGNLKKAKRAIDKAISLAEGDEEKTGLYEDFRNELD